MTEIALHGESESMQSRAHCCGTPHRFVWAASGLGPAKGHKPHSENDAHCELNREHGGAKSQLFRQIAACVARQLENATGGISAVLLCCTYSTVRLLQIRCGSVHGRQHVMGKNLVTRRRDLSKSRTIITIMRTFVLSATPESNHNAEALASCICEF
jgi:hypothetical protein